MTQMASSTNIKTAQQFINELTADGGTEMYRPLSNALIMKKNDLQTDNAIRQIVFITDDAVANEFELMQLLNTAQGNFRLYTIGIGAAPNGYFMKKAAQFGRGSYVFIQNNHNLQQKMTDFMTKISQPAISDIKLMLDNQVHQQVEVYPKKLPDLYFGEPLQIAIKTQLPIMHIQLSGETVSEPWYQQLIIDENVSSRGISTLWARRKIENLLDSLITGANKDQVKSQVITTSLTHKIISPYTSFIAVEKTIKKPPEPPYLLDKSKGFASKDLAIKKLMAQQKTRKIIDAHESLLVAVPQTSIGWQLQFIIGMILILLGLLFMKITDVMTLANKQLIKVIGNEKHN
jgi:Ca-activated chloride channel family protein